MPLSSNINAYNHIRQVLDKVVENRTSAKYKLASPKAARRWRFEAYYFRTLMHKLALEANSVPGLVPTTTYDNLRFLIEPNNPDTIIIEMNNPVGELIIDGKIVPVIPSIDPLQEAALSLLDDFEDERS